jgi:hypothetical protein
MALQAYTHQTRLRSPDVKVIVGRISAASVGWIYCFIPRRRDLCVAEKLLQLQHIHLSASVSMPQTQVREKPNSAISILSLTPIYNQMRVNLNTVICRGMEFTHRAKDVVGLNLYGNFVNVLKNSFLKQSILIQARGLDLRSSFQAKHEG